MTGGGEAAAAGPRRATTGTLAPARGGSSPTRRGRIPAWPIDRRHWAAALGWSCPKAAMWPVSSSSGRAGVRPRRSRRLLLGERDRQSRRRSGRPGRAVCRHCDSSGRGRRTAESDSPRGPRPHPSSDPGSGGVGGRAAHPTPRGAAFRCQMPSGHEQESATITDSRTTFPPASAGPRTSLNLGRRGSHQRRQPARRLGARRQSAVSDRRFALENIERPQLARGPNGTLLAVLRVAGGEIRARRPCLEILL